jgi:uncharacterized protein YjbI with pentapeptide repeats
MWLALGGTLILAVTIATVVTYLGLRSLHFQRFEPEPQLSAATLYDLLKVAFAVAAGIGGVVALVTAYRRQRVAEFAQELAARTEERASRAEKQGHEIAGRAEEREATRLFNERFTTAAGQLGSDGPAVRLAGVYAMAGLADDWPEQRQTCVDVLCAYLRMPYAPAPAGGAPESQRQEFRAAREVRHTVIRVINAHLQPDDHRAATSQDWRGLDLDFTGTVFDGGDFSRAEFTGGSVSFRGARFADGIVNFTDSKFTGGTVSFGGAGFTGSIVNFSDTRFGGSTIDFRFARFAGGTINFSDTRFDRGIADFTAAAFIGATVDFSDARFDGGTVNFSFSRFARGTLDFRSRFAGGTVHFNLARFTGATVDFRRSDFAGSTVDFSGADWTVPPFLPEWDDPPAGILLPKMR